eukprot:11038334-Heterocapsa_arctica.AAC.1
MNVYDDEENVNFEMALPLEGENALPRPDQPAAAVAADLELRPVVVAPPPASPETQEVRLCAELPSELHLMTHLPVNKFCNLKQKPVRRRWDPEMVEKP